MNRSPSPTPFAAVGPILAVITAALILATLSVLTLGFAGVVLGVSVAMAAFIALNYLLWGRWLGDYIRRQEAGDDDEDGV